MAASFGVTFGALSKLLTSTVANYDDQKKAFGVRIFDLLVKIKEELGIDDLMLAISDASSIASAKVTTYLEKYQSRVTAAITSADDAAIQYWRDDLSQDLHNRAQVNGLPVERSARNIEKLVAMKWKANYEVAMEDVNASMPLAQQIVSKYMSNFSAKAAPKV